MLTVCYTERNEKIRLITARLTTPNEQRKYMDDAEYEMPDELDFSKLRVRRLGVGIKSFRGVPNPDYDPRFGEERDFTPILEAVAEVTGNETGIDGKLKAPVTVTLDPDVADVFKNAAGVNLALRSILRKAGVL